MMTAFLVLALLVLFSAFLSVSEFAVVSSRRMLLEQAANRGNRGAQGALWLLNAPNRFLSTVQIGNTLCAIMAGAIAQAAITDHLTAWLERFQAIHDHAFEIANVIVVSIITYLWLIFGELVPKRVALTNPERTASMIAAPMRVLSRITAPVVWFLSVSIDTVMKLLPIRSVRSEVVTEEEIKGLIAQATQAGTFAETERDLVERIFRLGDQRVASLMVPRTEIAWLEADAPAERVRIAVATSSHSHFPVCEGGLDKIIGVVHLKDMIQAGVLTRQINLRVLARQPLLVPEAMPALRLLEEFRRARTHIAFVFDEYGVVTGLITLNDIVESMLGQIVRHGEEDEPLAVQREDGSWLLDGSMPVGDLKALMQVEALPHEKRTSFQTVAGFVMTYLGRIPRTGDRFTFDRFYFEVVDMDRHRIDKVLLAMRPAPDPATEDER